MLFQLSLLRSFKTEEWQKEKKYIEEQTNIYRQLYGLNSLKRNKELDIAAQAHADKMADLHFFAHVDPYDNTKPIDRVKKTRFIPSHTCENIYTCSEQPNMGHMAFSGWQVSDGHNTNLKREGLNSQGIGCAMAKKEVNGFVMWYSCHVFDNDKKSKAEDLIKKPLIQLQLPPILKHLRKEYHVLAVKELRQNYFDPEYILNEEFVKIAKNQIDLITNGKIKETELQKNVEKATAGKGKVVAIFQRFDTYQPPKRVYKKEFSAENKNKLNLISTQGVGVAIDLSDSGTFYFCLVALSN